MPAIPAAIPAAVPAAIPAAIPAQAYTHTHTHTYNTDTCLCRCVHCGAKAPATPALAQTSEAGSALGFCLNHIVFWSV